MRFINFKSPKLTLLVFIFIICFFSLTACSTVLKFVPLDKTSPYIVESDTLRSSSYENSVIKLNLVIRLDSAKFDSSIVSRNHRCTKKIRIYNNKFVLESEVTDNFRNYWEPAHAEFIIFKKLFFDPLNDDCNLDLIFIENNSPKYVYKYKKQE